MFAFVNFIMKNLVTTYYVFSYMQAFLLYCGSFLCGV